MCFQTSSFKMFSSIVTHIANPKRKNDKKEKPTKRGTASCAIKIAPYISANKPTLPMALSSLS